MISLSLPELSAYKQEWRPGQKVGKIIILRDISIENTHAGHLRILQDLANHKATNFNLAQMAWMVAIQLLQTLSMGYMYLFYRTNQRLKKIRGNDQMRLDYIRRKEKELNWFQGIFAVMVPIVGITLVIRSDRIWILIALGVPLGLYGILLRYQKYAVKKYLNHDLLS